MLVLFDVAERLDSTIDIPTQIGYVLHIERLRSVPRRLLDDSQLRECQEIAIDFRPFESEPFRDDRCGLASDSVKIHVDLRLRFRESEILEEEIIRHEGTVRIKSEMESPKGVLCICVHSNILSYLKEKSRNCTEVCKFVFY